MTVTSRLRTLVADQWTLVRTGDVLVLHHAAPARNCLPRVALTEIHNITVSLGNNVYNVGVACTLSFFSPGSSILFLTQQATPQRLTISSHFWNDDRRDGGATSLACRRTPHRSLFLPRSACSIRRHSHNETHCHDDDDEYHGRNAEPLPEEWTASSRRTTPTTN
jgi:hypothetical protein